jgi:hypothetical protein
VFVAAPLRPDVTQQLVTTAKLMLPGRNPLDIGAIRHGLAALPRVLDVRGHHHP